MAGNRETSKPQLIAEIAATRAKMIVATDRLRESMDFPQRARESIRRNRLGWAAAAIVGGLLLSRTVRRKKVVYVERSTGDLLGTAGKAGLVWTALKLVGGMTKPFLADLAKSRLQGLAGKWAERHGIRGSEQGRHS